MASVCYILSYYSPDYVRTRTLIEALQRIDGLRLHQARNSSTGILRYFETLWKLLLIRLRYDPRYYILGFRGYEHFLFVRILTIGKPLVFDHMMSPYDSLVNETRRVRKGGPLDRLIWLYERWLLQAADRVLTDTEVHRRYFQELFRLPEEKIVAVPVAADERIFSPVPSALPAPEEDFEVLYYGSFLPLHGMDVILKAAAALCDEPIRFTLIGGNRADLSGFRRLMEQLRLRNVTHLDWVEFEELPGLISRVGLGLGGPFGNTGQARRVITGKTFQFLAMAKAVVVGQIDEDCGFLDKQNCLLVPQGSAEALAEAIRWGAHHRSELVRIGREGYELYRSRYSITCVSDVLRKALEE